MATMMILFLWVGLSLTIIIGSGPNAAAQGVNPCDSPNNLPASFFEVSLGPQGTWTASVSPEPQQADNPLVPVVVAGAGARQGPANRRGMRLGCGLLINRSSKPVAAVRLRWILVRNQDRAAIAREGFTPKTVLQDGHSPAIELSIPKEGSRRTDFSIISFTEVTKDFAKDGVLEGDYFVFVGVQQVLFDDGSVWNAEPVLR
jgi:hypothetical protein